MKKVVNIDRDDVRKVRDVVLPIYDFFGIIADKKERELMDKEFSAANAMETLDYACVTLTRFSNVSVKVNRSGRIYIRAYLNDSSVEIRG